MHHNSFVLALSERSNSVSPLALLGEKKMYILPYAWVFCSDRSFTDCTHAWNFLEQFALV